jgi:cell division transport system permease protein
MKISGVQYLVGQGIENIWKNRMMSFASFCVLLVSILMVGIASLFYINISSMIGSVAQKNEVIVYIEDNATEEEEQKLKSDLEKVGNMTEIVFYSKEQAFEDLKKSMADYEVLFDSLGNDNPLIDAYRIKIDNIDYMDATVASIQTLDNVSSVRAPYDFVNILTQLRRIVSIIAVAVIIALCIVSVIIISNTTKASVFSRREEIMIMKYVGATDSFIRIPFFVEGMITGFAAGLAALILTWISYDSAVDLLTNQVDILSIIGVGSIVSFRQIIIPVAVCYLGAGALVGALGSTISTRKHINV